MSSSSSLPPPIPLSSRRNNSGGCVVCLFAAVAILYYLNNAYQILFMNQHARLFQGKFSSPKKNTGAKNTSMSSFSLLAMMNDKKTSPSDFTWIKRSIDLFLDRDEDGLASSSSSSCEFFSRTPRENVGVFSSHRYVHAFVGGNSNRVKLKTLMPKYVYRDAMAKYTEKNVKEIAKMSASARWGILSERRTSFFLRKRRKKMKNARPDDGARNENKSSIRRNFGELLGRTIKQGPR